MDWTRPDEKLVQEIVREAEVYLQAQLSLAIAADQRSSVMASLFTAGAAAIAAGLMTLAASDPKPGYVAIYVGGIATTTLLVIAAALCILAARPREFAVPGNMPDSWSDDVKNPGEFKLLLGQQAEVYQAQITENNSVLNLNAHLVIFGAVTGFIAPAVGFVFWLVLHLC